MTSHRPDVRVVLPLPGLALASRSPRAATPRRALLTGSALVVVALLAVPTGAAGIDTGVSAPSHSTACKVQEGLVTRTVGPGVLQVIADEAGHRFDGGRIREVEVGRDGTIVVAQGRRVIVLGEPGAITPRSDGRRSVVRALHLTPWGELWAVEDGGSVVVAEDGHWVDRSGSMRGAGSSIGALDDGSVWRVARSPHGPNEIVKLDGTGWAPSESVGLEESLGGGVGRYDFARTSDGRVWLGIDRGDRPGGIATYDEAGWRGDQLGTAEAPRALGLSVGTDGSLWVIADRRLHDTRPGEYVLLRHHEGTWSAIGPEQGMPQDKVGAWTDWDPTAPNIIMVDPDGRVWFSVRGIGLYLYDGVDFHRVEVPGSGTGVLDIRVDPDGRAWIVSGRGALYVVCGDGLEAGPEVVPQGPDM